MNTVSLVPLVNSIVEPLFLGTLGAGNVSLIERCPHVRGQHVHNPNVGTAQAALIRGVSLFHGVLIE